MFTIKMKRTVECASLGWKFHKGRKYKATAASNQPDWKIMQKIFVEKQNGQSMLLVAGDY